MTYFAGLDVSVKETSVCVVDDAGKIVREARVITARRLKAGSSICAPQCGRTHRPQPAALPREGWLPAVRPQSSPYTVAYVVDGQLIRPSRSL